LTNTYYLIAKTNYIAEIGGQSERRILAYRWVSLERTERDFLGITRYGSQTLFKVTHRSEIIASNYHHKPQSLLDISQLATVQYSIF